MNRTLVAAATLSLAVLVVLVAILGGPAVAAHAGRTWDFETDAVGTPPSGFVFGRTGAGRPGRWVVEVDPSAPAGDHVLAQVDADDADSRFPLAVAVGPVLKDVRAEVRCKPVSGRVDQACGLVVRYRDAGHYYLARANALEGNVNLYRVVGGRRSQLDGWSVEVAAGVWHTLALEVRGDRLRVGWEGKVVLEATDGTLREEGRVGVWTKADSVTRFDALAATGLP